MQHEDVHLTSREATSSKHVSQDVSCLAQRPIQPATKTTPALRIPGLGTPFLGRVACQSH